MNCFEKSKDKTREDNLSQDCQYLGKSTNFLIIFYYCQDLLAYWRTDQKEEPNIYPGREIAPGKNPKGKPTSLHTSNIKSLIKALKDEIEEVDNYQNILITDLRGKPAELKSSSPWASSTTEKWNPLGGILSNEAHKAMRNLLAHWENLDSKLCATEECKPNNQTTV